MSLNIEDVHKVARLARLAMTEQEARAAHIQLANIFGLIADMQAVDTKGITPMSHAQDLSQRLREDVVTENLATYNHIHLLRHEYIWHPFGWDWSALLFTEVHDKFQRAWQRAENFINMYREGLHLRAQKDKQFKERDMKPTE